MCRSYNFLFGNTWAHMWWVTRSYASAHINASLTHAHMQKIKIRKSSKFNRRSTQQEPGKSIACSRHIFDLCSLSQSADTECIWNILIEHTRNKLKKKNCSALLLHRCVYTVNSKSIDCGARQSISTYRQQFNWGGAAEAGNSTLATGIYNLLVIFIDFFFHVLCLYVVAVLCFIWMGSEQHSLISLNDRVIFLFDKYPYIYAR